MYSFSQGEILGTSVIIYTLCSHIIYVIAVIREGENRLQSRKGRKQMAERMIFLQSLGEIKLG